MSLHLRSSYLQQMRNDDQEFVWEEKKIKTFVLRRVASNVEIHPRIDGNQIYEKYPMAKVI